MKILITLLCFYFAGIVSLPCQDNAGIENHCQSGDTGSDEGSEHKECQPFCNCACCSSVIIDQLVSLELSIPLNATTTLYPYIVQSSSKFMPSIWQPPKIA